VNLEFRISDTGVGVSKERAESIFRPFSQADTSTTREYGGTGLGLPICRQLVALMGGDLQLESTLGQGSTFFFEARFELEERLSAELKAVTAALAGMRVLVLEGNNRARETLCAQLTAWNMEALATTTCDGALVAMRGTHAPNVALVDLRSLGADWRNRASELTKVATERGTSVVAVCSHKHEQSELLESGIRVHVQKPIRRTKIIAALLETLKRASVPVRPSEEPRNPSLPPPPPKGLVSNGMKILVAEDNEINRMVVRAHLKNLGYEVDTVNDGVAALEALQEGHRYAAVIMDGQMPNMDGYQVTRAQRARERQLGQTRVPIIALTVRQHEDLPNELKSGAEAPKTTGTKSKDREGVFVVQNGIATFRPVKVGIAGDEFFEVIDGLKQGDSVVAGPYQAVRDMRDSARVRSARTAIGKKP